jgi:integrase
MATVRKRRWVSGGKEKFAWIVDYTDQNGKRRIKTFKLKKDSDDWRASTQIEVKEGRHTADQSSVTVAEAAELWIKRSKLNGLRHSTIYMRTGELQLHILSSPIAQMKLSRLTGPMIETFYEDLLEKKSKKAARRAMACFKGLMSFAHQRGLVAQNVAARVRLRPRETEKLEIGINVPSKEDINLILTHAGRWRTFLVLAAFTGLRSGELRALTWQDCDFKRQVVTVRWNFDRMHNKTPPKTAAGAREIPMTPMVFNTLQEWRARDPVRLVRGKGGCIKPFAGGGRWIPVHLRPQTNLVFPSEANGGDITLSTISKPFAEIQKAVGLFRPNGQHKYTLHSLRHFFASWIIEQGFSPKRCQALLGHTSVQMTFDRYGHLFPSLEDDHKKFAAAEAAMFATSRDTA